MNRFLIPIFLIMALSTFSCRSSRKIVFFGDDREAMIKASQEGGTA